MNLRFAMIGHRTGHTLLLRTLLLAVTACVMLVQEPIYAEKSPAWHCPLFKKFREPRYAYTQMNVQPRTRVFRIWNTRLSPTRLRALRKRWRTIDTKMGGRNGVDLCRKSHTPKALTVQGVGRSVDFVRMLSSKTIFTGGHGVPTEPRKHWLAASKLVRQWASKGQAITLTSIHELWTKLNPLDAGLGLTGFRGGNVDANVHLGDGKVGSYFAGQDVFRALADLVDWYHRHHKSYHPIELAGRFYQRFVSIHPFPDSNGRLGGLLVDWILMKHGYPPTLLNPADTKVAILTHSPIPRTVRPDREVSRAVEYVTRGVERFFRLQKEPGRLIREALDKAKAEHQRPPTRWIREATEALAFP